MKPTRTYTTAEAAKRIGISRQSLFTWITKGRIVAPKPVRMGQRSIRFWTMVDIGHALKFKGARKSGARSTKKKT